jgi:hypothetical protein
MVDIATIGLILALVVIYVAYGIWRAAQDDFWDWE